MTVFEPLVRQAGTKSPLVIDVETQIDSHATGNSSPIAGDISFIEQNSHKLIVCGGKDHNNQAKRDSFLSLIHQSPKLLREWRDTVLEFAEKVGGTVFYCAALGQGRQTYCPTYSFKEALRAGIVGLHKTMTRRGLFASFTAKHVNVIK